MMVIPYQYICAQREDFSGRRMRQSKKHSHWKMTFDDGNLFLIDPRRFTTVKILKRLESNFGKDIIKNFDLKCFVINYGSRKRKVKH